MEELIKMVSDRTGLAPDKAQQAVDAVMSFLKAKLPPALASHIDGIVSGNMSDLGGIATELGGMGGIADMVKGVEKRFGIE
ncbi:MAG TPA: hypothetical protein VN717_08335 [Gemmatimonadaceae bacterium]|nr:hypothetical protein [Gemmatimonadaceae bacterium]